MAAKVLPKSHNCKFQGKLLEDNDLWIKEKELLLGIVATDQTKDPNMGDSYRVIEVYNTNDCKQQFLGTMAVNMSPDFPYFLEKDLYQKDQSKVLIRGMKSVFTYDLEKNKLLPPMVPKFSTQKEASDAQSGMILDVKYFGDYIVGNCRDFGCFAYDVNAQKPILPSAEYGRSSQLYFFKDKDKVQAVIPVINSEDESLTLKSMFKSPMNVDSKIADNVKDNRFIILDEKGSTPANHIAIDMKNKKMVDLPATVSTKSVGEILKYLKK